jgi:hypothetical protein
MSLVANMLDMDRNNVSNVVDERDRTNCDNRRIVDMAFWFGITSLIRPISLERIPTGRVLASTKQSLSAATSGHQLQTTQSLQRCPRRYPSDGLAASSSAKVAGAEHGLAPRDQYLFLECSSSSINAPVSRVIERERMWSTYCITGTDYEWVPEYAHESGHKWKRS